MVSVFPFGGLWGSWIKRGGWVVMVVLSLLIIASRKHYTVDVVIAWYVVFLVFNYVDSHLSNAGFDLT
jgi:hypothetical protein